MTTATDTDLFDQPSHGSKNPDNLTYTVDGKPDRYGRYRLPHPTSGRVMPWTRATTFAKSISDTYTLNMWGRRMTAWGLSQRPDLLALIAAAGLEERDKLNRICDDAAEHAGAKSAASLGTALHAFAEQVDAGGTPFIPPPWDADVAAYRAAMQAAGLEVSPGWIERLVVVPGYGVAGTLDRVLRMPEPCERCGLDHRIGDLKTGRDLSYGWLEIAIQEALYANAEAAWNKEAKLYEPLPELCRCSAVVMHLPVGKATCTMYDVDIQTGWEMAGLCAQVREARKRKNLAAPRATTFSQVQQVSGATRTETVVDRPPTYAERIAVARTSEELSAVWRDATGRGEWTDELMELGRGRQRLIVAETAGG